MNLVKRIRNSDRQAEQELFTNFSLRITRKVRTSLGSDNDDWQDVVCDVQMALLNCLRDGKFDVSKGSSLGSYIYGITTNKIRDYYKQKDKQFQTVRQLAEQDRYELPEDTVEILELQNSLRNLIQKLKMKYKEVLYLRYYEGLAVHEISQRIQLPARRVSERLNYAIKLLRKECQKEKDFSIFLPILIIYL